MHLKFFPSIFVRPAGVRFAEQESDEFIELFLRQHPIVNIPWILTAIFASLLPPAVHQLNYLIQTDLALPIPNSLNIAALVLWYMFITAYVIEKFLFWYFNIYIVTNLHIVDINFHSLLYRDLTEVEARDVQSVSARISGIFGSLFNYGDVVIETAAKEQSIEFTKVPRQDYVADLIQDLQTKARFYPKGGQSAS